MADVKISGLPASTTPLAGTEVLPIVQGGQTRQVSVANLTAGRAVSATDLTLTGVTTVSAGTAAAPSITTTGDTNTGVFFPTADTIAFAEGGAEVMRIDASSNVGIGTASPVGKLSVVGDILAPSFNTNTTYAIGIQNAQANASAGKRGNLKIQASSAISGAQGMGGGDLTLQAGNSYLGANTADGNILLKSGFNTISSGAAFQGGYIGLYTGYNSPEVMRVHASGGVSIGNTTDRGAASLNVSGLIYPQQATTAAAPAYVKGAIYFDTTLNKLRVGGATAWETITSA